VDHGRAARPPRVRVAWVTPAPPQSTGIADYAVEVADALSARFDLEWVLDPDAPPPDLAVARRFAVVRADEVEARHAARPYDLFIYHVGNNYFHTYMLPLMRRHPGLVMVHDLNLGSLCRLSQERGVWPGSVPDELGYNGEWLLEEWVHFGWVHPTAASVLSPLSRRVAESAAGVTVHSRFAWQQVRRLTDAPVTVVPQLAVAPAVGSRAAERERLGLPADRFIVCTLGHVGPHKRVPSLIAAAGRLPADVRARTQVLIVGPVTEAERAKLVAQAAEAGLPGRLEVRGKVPLDDLPAYAVAADVCVQLRYPFNGETSAALTRAMAAGACCVTSDMPTMAEVPNSASIKVRTPAREVEDLTAALTKLARDPELRDRLGANAKRYMAETHGPDVIAAHYAAAVENALAAQDARDGRWLSDALNAIADVPGGAPDALIDQWAKLRGRVLRPAVPTEALPELPEVPSERQTGKQAA
jgi:glycosyltransferase involved in cell wall biosynthesis